MKYTAIEPDFAQVLLHFGLITADQERENRGAWIREWEHLEDLHEEAKKAWRERPWYKRIFSNYLRWESKWKKENDSWETWAP